MKNLFFLLSLIALPPLVCVAQPKEGTANFVVEPAAKATLDKAVGLYHAAQGIRFNLVVNENGTQSRTSVAFQKPNLLRAETQSTDGTSKLLVDGKASYSAEGTTYKRTDLPDPTSSGGVMDLWGPLMNGKNGVFSVGLIPVMLEGGGLLPVFERAATHIPNARVTASVPPDVVVDGIALHGIKISFFTSAKPEGPRASVASTYLWFAPDGLLRRVSARSLKGKTAGQVTEITEQLNDQQLNPTFAPDTFKFDATGVQLASEPEEQPEFDPRLKVGAAPFAFSAKTLTGQTVSPAKYKGKVLILDFWATWCGPCVASMPELKRVYAKYHRKGLEIVGISLDEDKNALTSYLKTNKITWSQVYDGKGWESRVPGMYGVQAIPFFLVVGKNGKIAAVDPRDDLEGAVKKALAAK